MKILQIGKYYHPFKGGIETVTQFLSEGLVYNGDEVTVLCSHTSGERIYEQKKGVQVVKLPTFGQFASQPLTPSLFSELKAQSGRFDLLHFHAPNPLAEIAGVGLPSSRKMVVTYHSDIVRQKFLGRAYEPILKKFLHRVDRIVVASEQAIRHSPILPEFKDKCAIIPFGISPAPFRYTGEVEAGMHDLKGLHGRFILFTGRLVGYKGLDVLIHAVKDLDVSLVIAGDGPLQKEMTELAAALGVSSRVRFLGFVDDPVVFAALYHACEFFVLPSTTRAEAFGMVMLEAMVCGKPVISTRLDSGVSFVNEDGVSGLQVAPGSVDELREAIRRLWQDEELRRRLGEQARRRFHELFTFEKMVSSYRDLYRGVLGETASS